MSNVLFAACLDAGWEGTAKPQQHSYRPPSERRARLDRVVHDHLYPVFQPVVSTAGNGVEYNELLVRVRDDTSQTWHRKLIDVCERVGLIQYIDFFARDQALTLLAAQPDLSIACNVSLATVQRDGEAYLSCLAGQPAAARLVIEITESLPIHDMAATSGFVRTAQRYGARVALDDIGAGHFTLQDIATIRPDFVKLDCGLVAQAYAQELGHRVGTDGRLDLGSIEGASRAASASLIAEGIESAALLHYVHARGIALVQGYFTGRPAAEPCRDFPRSLAA